MGAENDVGPSSTSGDSKLNVRDLAKRFESITTDQTAPDGPTGPQTVRRVKKRVVAAKVAPPLTVALNARPKAPPPPFRKRSSKKRRTGGLSHSITELRISTGPVPTEGMAIKRLPSTKMRKSKSADANLLAAAAQAEPPAPPRPPPTVEPPKATSSQQTDRPILPMTVEGGKPTPPPKPSRLSAPTAGRISSLIQRRQEELAAAKLNGRPASDTAVFSPPPPPPPASAQIERPKMRPPPSPVAGMPPVPPPKVVGFKTRRRTIRKPSSRPPPPPPESRLYQTMSDESEEESPGGSFSRVAPEREAIRGRLADGTELPRLPSIAPPKPPSESTTDAEIGGLYEEIEYEFTLKSSNGNLAANSPSFSPRFARNSHERTPDRFRTSHPNLAPRESNELYAEAEFEPLPEPRGTQTLGRASANAIAAALKRRNGGGGFGRSLGSNSAAMSTSMAPAQFDTWTGGKKPKANRPISALDLVKLDRLTNGIQQITRRFKQAKSQDPSERARNFSTDRDTPSSLDSRLYGDEWDTEEDASDEEAQSEVRDDVLKYGSVHEPSESLLAEIESEYREYRGIHESNDCKMSDEQPSSSSSLSGINAKPSKLDRRLSAVVAMRASNSVDLETQSLCSSSFADEEAEMAAKNLVAELKAALPDEGDTESLSDLERKSLYESRLAAAQPLYQIYMLQEQKAAEEGTPAKADPTAVLTAAAPEEHEADSICDSGSDDLASVTIRRRQSSSASTDSGRGADTISGITSNNSMRRERLTVGSAFGSQRSLWCELPEVRSAGLLNLLDEPSKKLQESFFEVISSEASYLRSLNILIACFMCDPALKGPKISNSVITSSERKHLFSNVVAIRDSSERLLCDLETRLKNSLLLTDICDILCDHLESKFDAYKTYCANQVYQDRCLKRLKGQNSQFLAAINRIQSNPECQGLDIRSFLMLPMQRVCRLPLLVFAILDRVPPGSKQHDTASRALNLANQLVRNCNEAARRMERVEQLLEIERRLVYKSPDLKRIALINERRHVVKSGQLMQLVDRRMKSKLSVLQNKKGLRPLHLFLFNDILMIAEKKMNGTYVCKDYTQRRYVECMPIEANSHKIPIALTSIVPPKSHLFLLVLMQNARGKHVELFMNAESESDRERWLSSMRPPTCSNPDEEVYESWDCPQAKVVHSYAGSQEDELTLAEGDVVNILKKMNDGWYYGERVNGTDQRAGWFPSSYVQLINNDHQRAKQYRQRFRLMQKASEEFQLQQQRFQEKRGDSFTGTMASRNRLRRLSNPRSLFSA